jgi:micrococcal nuclease
VIARLDRGAVENIRLLGVDTPEVVDPRKPVQCFGHAASDFAYVILDGRRYNDELLERGFARFFVIPPNGSHARAMLREELAARAAGRGLWGEC